jgi:NDP-sugar pyrophosphorylase family protein
MKPTLVILAAGIGNRYGGLKQIDIVGPSGETIVDYSIYDAIRTGFGKIVFVIRKSIEKDFREVFLARLKDITDIDYVFQEIEDVPRGLTVPAGRTKPWGTSQAVIVSEPKILGPFAAINADDFYGREAFRAMAGYLSKLKNTERRFSLVGYRLGHTLSEHGSVARGICEVDDDGTLKGIVERTCIEKAGSSIVFKDESGRSACLGEGDMVSMNFWGFTPEFFKFAKVEFESFVKENAGNLKAELYIPLVINKLVKSGLANVQVLEGGKIWFGVTYKNDKPRVMAEIKKLVAAGQYPSPLWG